jgi:Ca2+-binding RTX toxin-like protein
MSTLTDDLRTEVSSFFNSVTETALDQALGVDIPLVGHTVQDAITGTIPFFSAIESAILGAIDSVDTATSAEAIATALDALDGVEATASGGKVLIHISATDSFAPAAQQFNLDAGTSALGIMLHGSAGYALTAGLDANFSFDAEGTHALTTIDKGGDELSLAIDGSLDLNGKGDLGFLDIDAIDKLATPEIMLKAVINFANGKDVTALSATDFTTLVNGDANLDLGLSAGLLTDETSLIPKILTDLIVQYHVADFDPSSGVSGLGATPTIQLAHIQLDLGSFVDWLSDVFSPLISDVFGEFPLGDLLDAVTTPLPVIDDASHALNLMQVFDLVGHDDMITLLDLAAAGGADKEVLNAFAVAFNFIKGINDSTGAGEADHVDLGSITLLGDAPAGMGLKALDASDPAYTPPSDDPFGSALDGLADTLGGNPPAPKSGLGGLLQPLVDTLNTIGLSIPLLTDPEGTIIPLLLNSSSAPVTLIQYDVPALTYDASYEQFFPIIGPIGVFFGGNFSAGVDVDFGYDTKGIATGNFADGFYFTTAKLPTPKMVGDEIAYYAPAGLVGAGVYASAGINVGFASAQVGGGLTADLEAYFPSADGDGKLYLATIGEGGCIFDPIHGELGVEVFVKAKVGFGPFSISRKFDIADVTLAEFNFGCHGNATDAGFGLATLGPAGGVAPGVLAINAGTRADDRSIQGKHGTDGAESFQVRNAYDDQGHLIAGQLDVSAYNINEHYGSDGNAPIAIFAQMGDERDQIVIAADVTQNAHLEGNGGDDLVVGGAGNDELYGDDGEDHLIGGAGNDHLFGGDDDDVLEGGLGADIIDGGNGIFDQVTYEHSAVGVTFTWGTADGKQGFIGHGGEAEGDVLYNVEYLIGSHFDDELHGNPDQSNTIEGLDGNDKIYGGSKDDFLLGGGGADLIVGGDGSDTTSYATSNGLVYVNLATGQGLYSDAAGDHLDSIENVQGSFAGDVLIGNSSDNTLDGWFGDDTIQGGGGHDKIFAGAGSDIVYGDADGDEIDGNGSADDINNPSSVFTPGRDLLSYAFLTGRGVSINLHDGNGDDNTTHYTFTDGSVFNSFEDLTGSNQNDNLTGDDQYNVIRGLDGADVIRGLSGNDVLVGGRGGDVLDGGSGRDLADYRGSIAGVYVDLTAGIGLANNFFDFGLSDALGDTLTSIENLRGSDRADTLIGNANATGVDGNNEIDPGLSRGGIDYVDGRGAEATDIDTLVLDYSRGDSGLGVTGGFDYVGSFTGSFRRLGLDNLTLLDGVNFDNIEQIRVIGTASADTIQGSYGNDTISTGGGDDTIDAGSGADWVSAGRGNDFVNYFTAANTAPMVFSLDGGRGIDTLSISTGFSNGIRTGGYTGDVTLIGTDGTQEFSGINLVLPGTGASAQNFEILRDVGTGNGNDTISQPGRFDNNFSTGFGSDVITPGLGVDYVNGGMDFPAGTEYVPGLYGRVLLGSSAEAKAILLAAGDKMVLDYSSSTDQVIGSVDSYDTHWTIDGRYFGAGYGSILGIDSNEGSYKSANDSVTFENIERLSVVGSAHNDYLVGTGLVFGLNTTIDDGYGIATGSASLRGDDMLNGGDGNDVLIGNSGDDTLIGGNGDDVLAGSDNGRGAISDVGEIDHLTGGAGADTFVLGSISGPLYRDSATGYGTSSRFASDDNRAIITDFDKSADKLALWTDSSHLDAGLYRTEEHDGSTFLYYRDGLSVTGAPNPAADELIAELVGVTGVDLNGAYVDYRTGFSDLLQVPTNADLVAASGDASLLKAANVATPSSDVTALDASWVTQTGDANALKTALFGGSFSPLGQGTLTIEGNSAGFGTFSGDPFGLGSGIVLSTGDVSDLAGPNLIDGGTAKPQTASLTFQQVAAFSADGGATIYRADLSQLGFDLKSLVLGDALTGFGGSGGKASGFDIDALVLSTQKVDSFGTRASFNDPGILSRLDAFGFNTAETRYEPGTQRAGNSSFPNQADLAGSVNHLPDFASATLDTADADGFTLNGALTLGDHGSIGLDLRDGVPGDGPLYLYVVESGDVSGEKLTGGLTASDGRLDAPTDLSTDLGLTGADDDTVTLTYTFTPTDMAGQTDGTVTDIALDFVFFSEELMEFAQSEYNDDFKILLNGVNLARLSDGSYASVNTLATPAAGPNASSDIFSLRTDTGGSDLIYNPAGTGPAADQTRADAYSKVLHFSGAINVGQQNVLTIEARDVRDGLLDSGILIKAGSLSAETHATFTIDRDGTPLDEGHMRTVGYHVDLPSGATASSPVMITLDPTDGLDLGGGAGVAVTKTVAAGGPYDGTFDILALPDGKNDGERTESVSVMLSGGGITDPVAPLGVLVDDSFEVITRTIGNAPERFSRAQPDLWAKAWTADGITITHTADHTTATPAYSAVDFGTLNPGVLSGSDMLAGDLGVSGVAGGATSVPQEMGGTEALRFDFSSSALSDFEIDFARFETGDSALLQFYDAGGSLVRSETAGGTSIDVSGLHDIASVIVSAAAGAFMIDSVTVSEVQETASMSLRAFDTGNGEPALMTIPHDEPMFQLNHDLIPF